MRRTNNAQLDLQIKLDLAKKKRDLAKNYAAPQSAHRSGGKLPSPGTAKLPPPGFTNSAATKARLVPQTGLEVTEELLGEGATGKVWLGRFGPSRTAVAVKVVQRRELNAESLGWIREEIAIHKQLRASATRRTQHAPAPSLERR